MTTQDAMAMQVAIARRIGGIAGCRLSVINVTMDADREKIEFRMDGWSPSLHMIRFSAQMPTGRVGSGPHVPQSLDELLETQERREALGHAAGTPVPYELGRTGTSPWRHLHMDASNLRFMIEMREDPRSAIREGVASRIAGVHQGGGYDGRGVIRKGDAAVCDVSGPPRIAVRRAIERYPVGDRCCIIFGQHLVIPIEIPHSVAAQCAGRRVRELADLGPEVNDRVIEEAQPNGEWLRVTMEPVWASLDDIAQMGAARARRTLGDMVAGSG
jgi:hypothetical protein